MKRTLPVVVAALALLVVPDVALAQDGEWIVPKVVGLFVGIPVGLLLVGLSVFELFGAVLISQSDEHGPVWMYIGRGGLLASAAALLLFVLPMFVWFGVFGVFYWSMPDMIWAGASAVVMLGIAVFTYIASRVLVVRSLS